jgi:uncharacterized BrkB/YihY/UPF0761 family membrane protein
MTETDKSSQDSQIIVAAINDALPLRKLRDLIDRLSISADAKALLMDVARLTYTAGKVVLNIGRKIVSLAFEIAQRFPKTTFGAVIAVIVTALIASIPFLGALLTPVVGPLLLAFGLTAGAFNDMRDSGWTTRVRDLEDQLAMVKV